MIRRGGAQDVPFLRDMLRHAYYWRWGRIGAEDLPASRYVDGWGRPGDRAMIGLDQGSRVGAAWYRLFRPSAPGWGFVDESTPELSIAVVPSRRGRGLGQELLNALTDQARRDGYHALSLSVERGNPSQHLYERFGFQEVARTGDTITMKADLASPAGSSHPAEPASGAA